MGTLEEIKKMQQEGHSEQDIIDSLAERGVSFTEINNSLAQTRIKQAVVAPSVIEDSSSSNSIPQEPPMTQLMSQTQGMQPSLLASESQEAQKEEQQTEQQNPQQQSQQQQIQQPQQEFAAPAYPEEQQPSYGQDYNQYAQYPQYPAYQQYGAEADAISEIAEQVIFEKISPLKSKIESVLDLKSSLDTKISYLEERLKRIEKVIDRLELSILQKVGSHMQNVEDIKSELIETQKSFKSLLQQKGVKEAE